MADHRPEALDALRLFLAARFARAINQPLRRPFIAVKLTIKAEPRRIHDVDRDSGTAVANRRWLRRMVRHQPPHSFLFLNS
jgi:hypothetical protein